MVQGSEASLKPYRVELGVQALAELELILERIAEDAGLHTAQKWSAKLQGQAATLRDAPYRGFRVEEWSGRRRLVVAPYVIVYEVSEPDLVVVQHFVDGRRDLDVLFSGEPGDD